MNQEWEVGMKTLNIIIVDDDKDIVNLLENILSEQGWHISKICFERRALITISGPTPAASPIVIATIGL